eukprot:symbB.v1.2.005436.t1/scaffold312.1/size231221/12
MLQLCKTHLLIRSHFQLKLHNIIIRYRNPSNVDGNGAAVADGSEHLWLSGFCDLHGSYRCSPGHLALGTCRCVAADFSTSNAEEIGTRAFGALFWSLFGCWLGLLWPAQWWC